MRRTAIAGLVSACLLGAAGAGAQTVEDATGVWRSLSLNMYSRGVLIEGRPRVFWYRESSAGFTSRVGASDLFSPVVVHGAIPGVFAEDMGTLDTPKGPGISAGSVDVEYERQASGQVHAIDMAPARLWTPQPSPARAPISTVPRTPGSSWSGVWFGNDGGIYYANHAGSRFGWFGEHCSAGPGGAPPWANVFVSEGFPGGGTVRGAWADVPYGAARGAGTMTLSVTPTLIRRTAVSGGFGGSEWRRASSLATMPASALVISFRSGHDGNRIDAVDTAQVELRGGRLSTTQQIDTPAWGDDARHATFSGTVSLPAGTTVGDIVAAQVTHDGAARETLIDGWDNWDVAEAKVRVRTPLGEFCLGGTRGATRLDGQNTTLRIPLMGATGF